jgi:ABC-2 type transport system permease protein
MFIVGPVLVLWLFSLMLNSPSYRPTIAVVDLPAEAIQVFEDEDMNCLVVSSSEAENLLQAGEIDAICWLDGTTLNVKVEGADPSKTGSVIKVVQSAAKNLSLAEREQMQVDIQKRVDEVKGLIDDMQNRLADFKKTMAELQGRLDNLKALLSSLPPGIAGTIGIPDLPETPAVIVMPELPDLDSIITQFTPTIETVEVSYLHGNDDWGTFDYFGPVFIGIFIFIFVFMSSGMSLLAERTGGTMERLLVTPIKPWQLVLGFCLGFGLFSLIQSGIVLWACIYLVGFPNEGSMLLVIAVTFSIALVSLNLGLLVSAIARTPFQVIQFMLLLVLPQVILSGIFDLSSTPEPLQILSSCLPLTYGAAALRDIMLRGAGFTAIAMNFAILWGFITVFFVLACLSFARRKSS